MQDLTEIASILDETIGKSLEIEQQQLAKKKHERLLLRKAFTFDPMVPHEVGEHSDVHNPYRRTSDGLYLPYSAQYWADQGKYDLSSDGIRYHNSARNPDGYRESERMLTAMKAVINDTVIKASFPIGTIHEYNGIRYQKEAPGKWVPIHEGNAADHPVEKDRQSKHDAIEKELEARKNGKQVLPATERTKQANKKFDDISQRERDLSAKEAELSQREVDHRSRELDLREAKLGKKPEKEKPEAKAKSPERTPEQAKAFETAKSRGYKVPPAWKNVWVNPDPDAALQVKGTDAKGRSQSIYSSKHHDAAAMKKFNRLKQFGAARKEFMLKIEADMRSSDEAKVLYLIDRTGFRIGSDTETGAKVKAYGASTLTSDHVKVNGSKVTFEFVGKKGVTQSHTIDDAKIAAMVSGKKGRLFNTSDSKVRDYLKSISKKDFKVKDFRTHVATSTALEASDRIPPPSTQAMTAKEKAHKIMEVSKIVAKKLGNTPTMARDSYIDPMVFDRWEVAA